MKLTPVVFGVLTAAVCQIQAQNIVYEAPAVPLTFQVTEDTEYADSMRLGGTDRFVTEASVTVFSDIARTGNVKFSLYAAVPYVGDPPVGQPGEPLDQPLSFFQPATTPLWTSGVQAVNFTGGLANLNTLTFTGIDTLVEDDLFWAIEFTDVSGLDGSGNFGPLFGDSGALTVPGSDTDTSRFYSRDEDVFGNAWLVTPMPNQAPPTSTMNVTITAVPEPAVSLLAVLGVFGLLRRRRPA